jgi:2-oxoglutarate ferredoxin oxidoreductase subunit alpha
MMEKRMKKLEGIRQAIGPPEIYPKEKSDIVLLGWGSTYGAIKEAVEILNRDSLKAQMLHFSEIYPFPSHDLPNKIGKNTRIFAVESNYTGQFADLFSSETGIPIFHKILKYDGRPITPREIITQVGNMIA